MNETMIITSLQWVS